MSDSTDSGGERPGPEQPTPEDPTPAAPEATEFEVDDITPSVPSAADVDPALQAMFWRLVVLYKLGILGSSLGVMLVVFDKGPAVGVELLVLALGVLGYALYRTRRGKERIDAGEFDDGGARDS